MTPKLLFGGVAGTGEGDIGSAVGEGKYWVVSAVWISNADEVGRWVTLKHYVDGSNTYTLLSKVWVEAETTIIVGPMVLSAGHKIRALAEVASKLTIVGYGLEGTA